MLLRLMCYWWQRGRGLMREWWLLLLLNGADDGRRGRRWGETKLLVNLRLRDESKSRRELRVRSPQVIQAHGVRLSKLEELSKRGTGREREGREGQSRAR